MAGPPLSLCAAVGVAVLTLCVALDAAPQDPMIHQVTDHDISPHRKFSGSSDINLLGTEKEFKIFMDKYGKTYSTRQEYMHRLGVFAKNMVRAAEHQALDPTAVHGVTPFSDLSEEEFERMYTGVRGGPGLSEGGERSTVQLMDVSGLPESFDWREKGAVTEVKMQVIS
jgi:cathepsin F